MKKNKNIINYISFVPTLIKSLPVLTYLNESRDNKKINDCFPLLVCPYLSLPNLKEYIYIYISKAYRAIIHEYIIVRVYAHFVGTSRDTDFVHSFHILHDFKSMNKSE